MHNPDRFIVTRRGALQGLTASILYVAGVALSPTPSPTPSPSVSPSPIPSPPVIAPLELVTVKCFDPDWTTEVIASFPRVVTVETMGSNHVCRVTWDSRLFRVSPVVLGVASEVVELPISSADDGSFTIEVAADVSALLFDVQGVNLYPSENIAEPKPTQLHIASGVSSTDLTLQHETASCLPWGVKVEAAWTTLESVIVPATVRLVSVGPNPAPTAIRLEIESPSGVSASPERMTPNLSHLHAQSGDQLAVVASLIAPLGTNELAEITYPVAIPDSAPARNPRFVSRATIRPPYMTGMRITECMSAFPLTESGAPVSSFVAEPTA